MGKTKPKTIKRPSWLWYVCSPWYLFVDKFFWYFWRPLWGFVFYIPSFLEEFVFWGTINFVKRKINPSSKSSWGTEFFYGLCMKLMFQCPNCRSSHLDELWEKRMKRHGVPIPWVS